MTILGGSDNDPDNDAKPLAVDTHREHFRKVGGGRRRHLGTVHDDLESLNCLDGIRTSPSGL